MGLSLQFLIAIFVLQTGLGQNMLKFLSGFITSFLEQVAAGFPVNVNKKGKNFIYDLAILPAIVLFCTVISIVYFFGGIQYIIQKFAWLMVRLMDTSGAETIVAVAAPFVGQGNSALLVKPFVEQMTMSELHSVMTSGCSTIAGFKNFLSYFLKIS